MTYRIESDSPLSSVWLSAEPSCSTWRQEAAVAIAIEGVDDPDEQEVRVVCVETGEVVWRSTEEEYE